MDEQVARGQERVLAARLVLGKDFDRRSLLVHPRGHDNVGPDVGGRDDATEVSGGALDRERVRHGHRVVFVHNCKKKREKVSDRLV